jgi:hypothetical protein
MKIEWQRLAVCSLSDDRDLPIIPFVPRTVS